MSNRLKKECLTRNDLIQDGFSEKFADIYLEILEEEKKREDYDEVYGAWAHAHGFFLESAYAYGLNEGNVDEYFSDYDYAKTWPMNSWSRIWVDDKLTLKYVLDGTEFSHIMPEYYLYSTKSGLRRLMDYPSDLVGKPDLATLLKQKKVIACKPNNGSKSMGFFRLSYRNDTFWINKKSVTEAEIRDFAVQHPNYIFTEYLFPCQEFARVNSLIHTLRVVVVNTDGDSPRLLGGYFRFGTNRHGETNHMNETEETKAQFDFVCEVNLETGHIGNAKSVYFDRVEDTPAHPDSGVVIDFAIPGWERLRSDILGICRYLSNLEYLGFDIGVTDQGAKLMEINTYPGMKYMQIFHPLYEREWVRKWVQEKIEIRRNV